MKPRYFLLLLLLPFTLAATEKPATSEVVWLDSLNLNSMQQDWGKPRANRSVGGDPLSIGGKKFDRGVGTHSYSNYWLLLKGGTERFIASVGVDDSAGGPGTVIFQVSADGKIAFNSGVMKVGEPAKVVDLDLRGVRSIILTVRSAYDGIAFDHGNWADARLIVSGRKPVPIERPAEAPYLLTPKPGLAPRINGPVVYGARPGRPFLYRIPTQGERPMKFTARGLPEGLKLDPVSGLITGTTPERGEYPATLIAENSHGQNEYRFKIISGDKISLTPYMGWNGWYSYYDRITAVDLMDAADAMLKNGMADVGYDYVNIDDCWMYVEADPAKDNEPAQIGALRDAQGLLRSNGFFPDMKGLADYLHARGFKAGLYTSPGPTTCQGFAGAYGHEEQDAKLFADWGFDLLKYDWCGYSKVVSAKPTLEEMQRPFRLMGGILQQQSRDIIFNICQYGMGDVWKWGAEVGGHSWRTGYDLGHEMEWFFEVALMMCELREWHGPGAWNDPDYVLVGPIGNAQNKGKTSPSPYTPTEQYAFMSLWALTASPLIYGGDVNKLDEFTLNVLCNPEIIAVNLDPLGQCARVVTLDEDTFLMVKDLADGSKAVGLCNRGETPVRITARWADLGVSEPQAVRDLWRGKDMGVFDAAFEAEVGRHGVYMMRVGVR